MGVGRAVATFRAGGQWISGGKIFCSVIEEKGTIWDNICCKKRRRRNY